VGSGRVKGHRVEEDTSHSKGPQEYSTMVKYMGFGWARWHTPVIPALGMQRQEDIIFKVSLGYKVRTCLIKTRAEDVTQC
jgi:hypothetical protein